MSDMKDSLPLFMGGNRVVPTASPLDTGETAAPTDCPDCGGETYHYSRGCRDRSEIVAELRACIDPLDAWPASKAEQDAVAWIEANASVPPWFQHHGKRSATEIAKARAAIVAAAAPLSTPEAPAEMRKLVERYGKGCWCFGADNTESNAKDAKHHEDALLSAISRIGAENAELDAENRTAADGLKEIASRYEAVVADREGEIERLRAALSEARKVVEHASEYEHDEGAHRHGTPCLTCRAEAYLAAASRLGEG